MTHDNGDFQYLPQISHIADWLIRHFPDPDHNVTFFCDRDYTRDILQELKIKGHSFNIPVLFDEGYHTIGEIGGIKCDTVENLPHYNLDVIFAGKDYYEQIVRSSYGALLHKRKTALVSRSTIRAYTSLKQSRIIELNKIWNWLSVNFSESKQKVAFFCGGKFTRDLLSLNYGLSDHFEIPVIFDENFKNIGAINGIKCDSVKNYHSYEFELVFIGTDSCEQAIKKQCLACMGDSEVKLIGLSDIHKYIKVAPGNHLRSQTKQLPFGALGELDDRRFVKPTVAIHVFFNNSQDWHEAAKFLGNMPYRFSLFISYQCPSTSTSAMKEMVSQSGYEATAIFQTSFNNSVEAFIHNCSNFMNAYEYWGHFSFDLQTSEISKRIRDNALTCLAGSERSICEIFGEFAKNKNLSVCYPEITHEEIRHIQSHPDYPVKNDAISLYAKKSDQVYELSDQLSVYASHEFFWIRSQRLVKDFRNIIHHFQAVHQERTSRLLEYSLLVQKLATTKDCYALNVNVSYEEAQIFKSNNLAQQPNKIIAFYFPDFEKPDAKLALMGKATALFPGHLHPRAVHESIKYYDLPSEKLFQEQVKLAQAYGLGGFCISWDLPSPLQPLIRILTICTELKFDFCLHVRSSSEAMKKSALASLLRQLACCINSGSYIKILQRPVFIIESAAFLSDGKGYIKRWRQAATAAGLGDIYIMTHEDKHLKKSVKNELDAVVENPFSEAEIAKVPDRKKELNTRFSHFGAVCTYDELSRKNKLANYKQSTLRTFRSVGTMWDPSPWLKDKCNIVHGTSPDLYQNWLAHVINDNNRHLPAAEKIIFLRSWNDWEHGAYLEPDSNFGYSLLNATARALLDPRPWPTLYKKPCAKPKVSIIIPCYNQWSYTYHCIESILHNTVGLDYEIIIGDDNSTDETATCESFLENISLVRHVANKGFLENCNLTAATARGRYIFFLNNDTYVHKKAIMALATLLDEDKTIGMTGSKLLHPDNTLQEAGGIIWQDASGWNYGRGDNPDLPEYNYLKDVDYISGAAIMIRRDLWHEIGGFDKRFRPAYYEDSDLAFMVRKHGFRVVYNPQSVVTHFEGISCGTSVNAGIKKYQITNQHKFAEKHAEELKAHYPNGVKPFKARDRSGEKKVILVIDHYAPTFDKDAGSRTMLCCLVNMVKLGYSVKFIGDNFIRQQPYVEALEKLGIEVLYGAKYAHNNWHQWLIDNGQFIDFAYLNRPHTSIKYIDHIKELTKARIVYNVVDLHYKRLEIEAQVTGSKRALAESARFKKIETELISKAAVVFSVSNDEVNFINRNWQTCKAMWLPVFSKNSYGLEAKFNHSFEDRTKLLFVGSYRHSPNKDAIDWFIKEVFPSLLSAHPDMVLNVVGDDPENLLAHLPLSKNIRVHGHVSDDKLSELYKHSRVVVIPLQYGAGLKGKTMEAILYGVPFVGTKYAIEGFPEKNKMFKSYDKAPEFAKRVNELFTDEDAWKKEQRHFAGYADKYFSDQAIQQVLNKAFSKDDN